MDAPRHTPADLVGAGVTRGHRRRAADTLARRDPGGLLYGAVITAASWPR